MAQRIANQRAQREIAPLSPSAPASLGTPRSAGRGRERAILRWRLACLALCVAAPVAAMAADVPCAVGTRVSGEFGGGESGTIAEIGSQPPHVGAYRITFSWSPRGEWYHPNTWQVHPAGSSDRCVVAVAALPPPPAGAPPEGAKAQALAPGSYTCSASGAGFFRVEIRDDGSYSSSSGNVGHYTLDAATAKISFTSGSLAAYQSKLLGPGKFGLSGDSSTRFHTVCNLKK